MTGMVHFQHAERLQDGWMKYWFPEIRVPQNGWVIVYIVENPMKVDDLGVPLF